MTELPAQPPASPQQPQFDAAAAAAKAKTALLSLPRFEQFVLGGGVAYLIGSFLPVWATKTIEYFGYKSPSVSANLWDLDGLYIILAVLVLVIALALPFLNKIAPAFKLPVAKPMLYLAAGVVGILIPLFRWLTIDNKDYLNLGFGFFILLAGGALIAFGGLQSGGAKMLQGQLQKMRTPPTTPPAAPPQA